MGKRLEGGEIEHLRQDESSCNQPTRLLKLPLFLLSYHQLIKQNVSRLVVANLV